MGSAGDLVSEDDPWGLLQAMPQAPPGVTFGSLIDA